jgi:hypothetical protein
MLKTLHSMLPFLQESGCLRSRCWRWDALSDCQRDAVRTSHKLERVADWQTCTRRKSNLPQVPHGAMLPLHSQQHDHRWEQQWLQHPKWTNQQFVQVPTTEETLATL